MFLKNSSFNCIEFDYSTSQQIMIACSFINFILLLIAVILEILIIFGLN